MLKKLNIIKSIMVTSVLITTVSTVQAENYSNGYCGGFLLRTSGLMEQLGPAYLVSAPEIRRDFKKMETAFSDIGTSLMIKGISDGSGVRDGDRGAKFAVDELSAGLMPLVETNSRFYKRMMFCAQKGKQ